ncbi:probable G-protein coupled receptor Mth-like 5 [Diachasma alloeum]|uniref:probable G-protein coupled receptor Mth-like 5 n=1 Tax=Diachasma alloeum TaxID=454923 RepID=UPI000738371C|nr:probable G-protein coupled receptor Mth-like 5 [Diachasma alloeum]
MCGHKREMLPLLLLLSTTSLVHSNTGVDPQEPSPGSINIAKCCELNEILVDSVCTPIDKTNESSPWKPEFVDDQFPTIIRKKPVNYQLRIGSPVCSKDETQWQVYYGTEDKLVILTSGKLRHVTHHNWLGRKVKTFDEYMQSYEEDESTGEPLHQDYAFGHYCAEKAVLTGDRKVTTYAIICVPNVKFPWRETSYLVRNMIDPITRASAIASYLVVAVVYFVLPQLRDLVGNMISSMSLCLVVNQIAATVGIFTQHASHISFLVADTVAYVSLLAAFFWLNALGYFVWNTFRSRNVFLRVTDRRKYCYYSFYVWGSTLTIAATALFAHFALDDQGTPVANLEHANEPQETVGVLAMSVLFTSVAFTIIVDLCFVLNTANTIKRMCTYGRIHHKMKYSFRLFTLMYVVMSIGWLSVLMSQIRYDEIYYAHIFFNIIQALSILYICVFGQKRVTFLLSKTCNCCTSSHHTPDGLDWGEEMTAINAGY